MFVQIDSTEAEKIRAVPELTSLYAKYTEALQRYLSHGAYAETARASYVSDDLKIDDTPAMSAVEGEGCWIQAWVWVSNKDARKDVCESYVRNMG